MPTIAGASRQIAGKFYDKGGSVFNVKHPDFGAKVDGVTDDYVAVQAAIDAARLAGGGTVVFPPSGICCIGTTLKIGDAGVPADGVVLQSGRLAARTTGATLKWIGATGGDNAILSIRNAHQGAIRGLGFDAANKADYCVQIRHVTGDANVSQHWDHQQCTYTAARKYNFLIGEIDGVASVGDASVQNFYGCFWAKDQAAAANTTAHLRARSTNALAVNVWGSQFDSSTKPTYGLSIDSGWVSLFGMVSVGEDNIDIFMETVAGQVPPCVCVYGWESQSTNFMRANLTGGATVQRSSVLSAVRHHAILGTPGDAIQWNQSGGHGGLVLAGGCRFDEAVNIQSATARVWSTGTVFVNSTKAFTGNPQVVDGSWGTPLGYHHQVPDAIIKIGQVNDINHFESTAITIANNGVATIGTNLMGGILFVSDSENISAIFMLRGTGNVVTEMLDPVAIFSAVAGTATSTNVYWNGATSRYEIENKRGASRDYRMNFFGKDG